MTRNEIGHVVGGEGEFSFDEFESHIIRVLARFTFVVAVYAYAEAQVAGEKKFISESQVDVLKITPAEIHGIEFILPEVALCAGNKKAEPYIDCIGKDETGCQKNNQTDDDPIFFHLCLLIIHFLSIHYAKIMP